MEHRKLGRSGLNVSKMCLGAMTFGIADDKSFMHKVGCDAATSMAMMNRALDEGVNFIDTADVYGQDGLSERVIGDWFTKDKRRDEVVLATKFRFRMGLGDNGTGASRYRIMRCVEDSLRRLKTDRIDLYQIHMQDLDTPEDEILRALDDLVRAGKVLYIGASNYAAHRLVGSVLTSQHRGLSRYVSLQPQYSLMCRDIEREHVPACIEHGVGIIPWSPLGGGFLTGKYSRDQEPPTGSRMDKWKERYQRFNNERNWAILDVVRSTADELGASPAQIALAWLMNKPGVTSVIFGARSLAQLDDNLAAATIELPEAAMKALDEVSALDLGYPYGFISQISGGRW